MMLTAFELLHLICFLSLNNVVYSKGTYKYCNGYVECADTVLMNPNGSSSYYALACSGSKSCESSTLTDFYYVLCEGDSSCKQTSVISATTGSTSYLDSSGIVCYGYGSCYSSPSMDLYHLLYCYGPLACSNISMISFVSDSVVGYCWGLYSCINSYFMSDSSYRDSNSRSITLTTFGTFDLYNGTFISDRNNIYLTLYGYYSGYGLSVSCSSSIDVCTIYCYGLSCFNMICNGDGCNKKCQLGDDEDLNCGETKDLILSNDHDIDENGVAFDYVARLVNKLLETCCNYTILPNINNTNLQYIDYANASGAGTINSSVCEKKYLTGSEDKSNANITGDGNICCLGDKSCYNAHKMVSISGNIYCNGYSSCQSGSDQLQIDGNSVYCGALEACESSSINFTTIVACETMNACGNSVIMNGKTLLCSGYESCSSATIINVENVIGLGYGALSQATISNATNIYLVGYKSGHYLSISDGNPIIYCQTSGCDDDVTTQIYCEKDVKFVNAVNGNSIDNKTYNLNYNITSYADICSLLTPIPTEYPSYQPSNYPSSYPAIGDNSGSSSIQKAFDELESFLTNATIIIPLILFILSSILIVLSFRMRNKKHPINLKSGLLSDGSGDDSGKDSFYSVNYRRGFGKNASHLVIGFIFFEIYDVFTDIAYLIEQYSNEYYLSFYVFLISIICTIIINTIIVSLWLKHEFSNATKTNSNFRGRNKFQEWFYEHSGVISFLLLIFLLSDVSIISNVFTSQIFGLSLFYSPMSIYGVNMLNISTVFSIFVEHLPQLIIQIYAIKQEHSYDDLTVITMGTLIVSCIDVLFIAAKGLFWFILHKTIQEKESKQRILMMER